MKLTGKLLMGTALIGSLAFGATPGINFYEMATLPSFSIAAPSGLVPSWGVVFAGIAGTTNSDTTDGALALGMGFGDAEKIGGSAILAIGSIDPRDGGAFNRGDLNLNVGHYFSYYGLGAAIGVSGIDLWHDSGEDELDPSFYGALTKLLPNDIAPVIVTAGFGNNAYSDINKSDRKDKIGGFVSAAAYVHPKVSLIADYTSNIVSLGVGLVPFQKYPISMILGAYDVTEQYGDKVSFLGSLSAAYVF